MKSLCLLVVSVLVGGPPVAAQAPRIRPLDPLTSAAYERGHRQSARFRALVVELDASDLIVHIVTTAALPPGVSGTTRLVTHLGGARYVRVELASSLALKLRVSILAHELQHACELAQSGARTASAVRALYQTIGRMADGGAERFETSDAERVGRLVWVGTGRGPRPRTHRGALARAWESRRASPKSQHPPERYGGSRRFAGWPRWQAP